MENIPATMDPQDWLQPLSEDCGAPHFSSKASASWDLCSLTLLQKMKLPLCKTRDIHVGIQVLTTPTITVVIIP